MQYDESGWLTYRVLGTDEQGVEVPKLARVLESLSAALYAIARASIGEILRPGPRTAGEDALAAVRLIRIEPGSATIVLAPPPSPTPQLALTDEPTPDDVAFEFIQEVKAIDAGKEAPPNRLEIRRRVYDVLHETGQIGTRGEIVFHPLVPRSDRADRLTASFRVAELPAEVRPAPVTRTRRVSGHAFMVDVEPGRQRLRVKLPDGRDTTIAVTENLISRIREALDSVVELEVDETLEGTATTDRVARSVTVLPTSRGGDDKPPKSVGELAEEQHLPRARPDYIPLASDIWTTEEQIAEFEKHLQQIRQSEKA